MVFVHCLCETYPHYSTGVPFGFPLQPPTRSGKTLPSLDSTCVIVLTPLETLTCLVQGGVSAMSLNQQLMAVSRPFWHLLAIARGLI